MSYLVLGVAVVLAVLLQSAPAPPIKLLDLKPDLLLILMAAWGTARGSQEAISGGIVGGILMDIQSHVPLGITALALLPVAFVAGQSRSYFQGTHPLVLLTITFCGTFVYYSITLLALQATGSELDWFESLARVSLPVAILNSLISYLPFWALGRFRGPTG
ncbi:MAG: rod shape-determining protein MreD [Chloroflexi bacterium]|nr:rod shape-determining protein MreD [Chloroflexota bacterium]